MRFARWVFRIAGIYGILAIAPMYFYEERLGRDMPPPLNHPEFYYGFAGVTLAWQIAFLVISIDPVRYRLMMLPAMVEKFAFVTAAVVLFAQGRIPMAIFGGAMLDLVFGVLFVTAYLTTTPRDAAPK